ncbi:hypothetical protein [Sphingobacterium yanglingense]|uniref:Uncharacterized protein n=1 Tax=Sphingobacterium yanglingense TaxID=1437280 RepID=A0A4V3DEB5_9SPHI|nr:hypothetical protein [Sphingobacterium yanglingense]TDQ79589.1 hypothetical protein CLV99_1034 [Sphingobacterium yanglingense]
MSNYRINGQDPETLYNLQILKGIYEQLDQKAELKDNGLSIDWAEENGTERYHGLQRFKSKTYNIQCLIKCNTSAEYDASIEAFDDFIDTAGEFNLDIVSKNKRLKVSFLNMTNFKKYGNSATFTLVLADDYPTEKFTIS